MRINGPYARKDGRLYMSIKTDDGKKTTMSYPKYYMEQVLGRKLESWETVDHIDNDKHNNDPSNFQILSYSENSSKSRRPAVMVNVTCACCGKQFSRLARRVSYDLYVRDNNGVYCSRKCAGTLNYKHKNKF